MHRDHVGDGPDGLRSGVVDFFGVLGLQLFLHLHLAPHGVFEHFEVGVNLLDLLLNPGFPVNFLFLLVIQLVVLGLALLDQLVNLSHLFLAISELFHKLPLKRAFFSRVTFLRLILTFLVFWLGCAVLLIFHLQNSL